MQVAVIGAGWWGKNIVNTFEELDAIDQVHVFDQNPDVYAKFAKNRKTVPSKSMDAILQNDSIDGICVSTPPQHHYDITKRAFLSKKHVLVEKPPAQTLGEVEELIALAEKNHLIYMLNALYLFLEPIIKLKEILLSGKLKEIRLVQMYRLGDEFRRAGSGIQRIQQTMFNNATDVVDDLFFHDAGILLHLFGDMTLKTVQKQQLYHSTLCDSVEIQLLANGIPIQLYLSWSYTGRRRGLSIYDLDWIVEYDGLASENQISQCHLKDIRAENFSFASVQPLKPLLQYFIDAIVQNQSNNFGPEFMMRIMKLWSEIHAIR